MKENNGFFTVELTIIITLILVTILTVLVMLTNTTKKMNYTIDNTMYEDAFHKKIEEIRLQKIMKEVR